MGSLLKSLLLAFVLLFYFCECQNAEDFIQMKLDAILEAQSTIIRRLDEQKSQQDVMEESLRSVQQTVEDLRVECQQCAQRDQVDIFQNVFTAGQQEIVSSLQQCPCIDQIADIQDLLNTTDECSDLSHNCSQMAMCSDTPVSYKCSCLPGYSGDGFDCHDIDECTSEQHDCATKATCTNLRGTYECECDSPYIGDGYTCDYVCESPSISIGGIGCISLISSKGIFSVEEGLGSMMRWEAAKEKCKEQPGGGKLLENITVEHVKLLSQHFSQITTSRGLYAYIGVKHSTWITSGVSVASNLWMDDEPDGGSEIYGFLDLNPPTIGLRDGSASKYALCQFSLD